MSQESRVRLFGGVAVPLQTRMEYIMLDFCNENDNRKESRMKIREVYCLHKSLVVPRELLWRIIEEPSNKVPGKLTRVLKSIVPAPAKCEEEREKHISLILRRFSNKRMCCPFSFLLIFKTGLSEIQIPNQIKRFWLMQMTLPW